jgi:hypothetical protein
MDKYGFYATASDLVDEMRSRGMDTVAFGTK